MAIEFARVRYVSRSDGGNACRSAAYNARSDVRCERTGERFFFAHRDPGLHHEMLLPAGATARFLDPAMLWNAAQAMERRRDSQEARELLLALPSDPGLDLEDWTAMCREFAQEHFVGKGIAVQLDIHAPHDGDVNVHAHLLITTRRIEGEAFSPHKARDLDPEVRTMKGKQKIVTEAERWGALWRDYQNLYFERQGLELRVDETGFVPQRHEGPVRLRTVPDQAEDRLEENYEANQKAARDPGWVLGKLIEKRATFTASDIERLTRKYIPVAEDRDTIRKAVLARPEVVPLFGRETGAFANRFTTTEVREQERAVMASAERVAASRRRVDGYTARRTADERRLDDEQRVAFLKATGTDGLVVIEGLAGTGKSYSLNAIREAHERDGWRVVGVSLMNTVADDLRRSGFSHANTAHREVWWQERGGRHDIPRWDRRTVVMVEEAGMLDTPIYDRLMRQAAETGAKVILAGDDRQQGSVQRGRLFTQLKERHGSVVISKVRRQGEDWQRVASEDFAQGHMAAGLRAYAERGHVHWSAEIEESRARLLSDWDQDSRERPEINRFVYASTNVEVNRINRAIHDIRVARGEVADALEIETVKGKLSIGIGERLQFHGNDRKNGILNGALSTVTDIEGYLVTARTDAGRAVQFDTRTFDEFGLGYAGTVYRGQGKTQTEVYALYDNIFAWNARTAYVGLTRHTDRVELYVSRDLAASEVALADYMGRKFRDGASLEWATRGEVVDIQRQREGHGGRQTAGSAFRNTETEALRRLDLAAYARDVHGFAIEKHPSGDDTRSLLVRAREGRPEEQLEVRRAADGHWTWRDTANPRLAGDIFDLARREGAPDLKAAREAVAAYDEAMRAADSRRRAAEEKARIEIDATDPDRAAKQAGVDEQRRLDIAGAAYQDRLDAAGEEFAREEAARIERLNQEAAQARDTEQQQLHHLGQAPAPGGEAYVSEQTQVAERARSPEQPERRPEPPVAPPAPESHGVGLPTSAQLRYTEALAQHYDPLQPTASLARASLAEAAAWQRDRHQLDQRIGAEPDQGRRDALLLRRDIEHTDHMAQAYGRIAGLARATGANERHDYKKRVDGYIEQGAEARRTWAERGQDHPDLYPPLNPALERKQEQAREAPAQVPEQAQEPRSPSQEREAMKRLDLPEYAAAKHGYQIDWRNDEHSRAALTKGAEELRATKDKDGAWSYESRTAAEHGDILDFEIHRGARTAKAAREAVRPELERVEQERERLDPQPDLSRGGPEREGPSRDDDGPELDPNRRRGRGR